MDSDILSSRTACASFSHLLRFTSLHDRGRAVTVPCDEAGIVDMDALTERLLLTYLGARALVGRDYSCPTVQLAQATEERGFTPEAR